MNKNLLILTACFFMAACSCNSLDRTTRNGMTYQTDDDGTITQRVRDAIADEDDLSSNAKNIDISTDDGVVTLQGVVNSPQEKDRVIRLARGVSGVKKVNSNLSVSSY